MSLLLTCQAPCVWVPRVEAWDSGCCAWCCGPSPGSRPAPADQGRRAGRSALGAHRLPLEAPCVSRGLRDSTPPCRASLQVQSCQALNSGSSHSTARRPTNSPRPAAGLCALEGRPRPRPCCALTRMAPPGSQPRGADQSLAQPCPQRQPGQAVRLLHTLPSPMPLPRAHPSSQTACCLHARPFYRGGRLTHRRVSVASDPRVPVPAIKPKPKCPDASARTPRQPLSRRGLCLLQQKLACPQGTWGPMPGQEGPRTPQPCSPIPCQPHTPTPAWGLHTIVCPAAEPLRVPGVGSWH